MPKILITSPYLTLKEKITVFATVSQKLVTHNLFLVYVLFYTAIVVAWETFLVLPPIKLTLSD